MRRVLGATILVLALGGSDLVHLALDGSRTDDSASPAGETAAPGVVVTPGSGLPGGRPAGSSGSALPATFRTDPLAFLSTAPADSLDLLPGIGPVLASRIVAARHGRGSFTSWDDVLRVHGIGPRIIEKLKAQTRER